MNSRVFVVLAGIFAVALAQVAVKGHYRPGQYADLISSTKVSLPVADYAALAKADQTDAGGYQFAYPVEVRYSLADSGRLVTRADGSLVWLLNVASQGAISLSLTFSQYRLPAGVELYVYSRSEAKVHGAFTALNNKPDGRFGIVPILGSEVTLELYIPSRALLAETELTIDHVAHGFRPIFGAVSNLGFGDAGSCNVNVECAQGAAWKNETLGVVMLLRSFGSRFCSGSMINNVEQDGRQLFLTAYHCTASSDSVLLFNYNSPACTPNTDGNTDDTVSGVRSLAQWYDSDVALFEVLERIPEEYDAYLNGFSAINVPAPSTTCIHHPRGDVKKISFAYTPTTPSRWVPSEPGNLHWQVNRYDLGTTEPGSSGSPLFDNNHRIVGQLHGGPASCTLLSYDRYGALWASWDQGPAVGNRVSLHLDPNATGQRLVGGAFLNTLRTVRQQAIDHLK